MKINSGAFHPRSTLGQNFLIDNNVVEKIVRISDISSEDVILEVGSGKGILTRELLKTECRKIHTVEIDKRLKPFLEELNDPDNKLNIIWEDAVKYDYLEIKKDHPGKLIANLPYNITTPLLWRILETLVPVGLDRLIIMIQKESAQRLCAEPGTRERYPLGITIQTMGIIRQVMKVSRQSFRPVPDIDSVVVDINLLNYLDLPSVPLWRKMLRSGFSQRRKTLAKNLVNAGLLTKKSSLEVFLSSQGLNRSVRAEELNCQNWLDLLKFLEITYSNKQKDK